MTRGRPPVLGPVTAHRLQLLGELDATDTELADPRDWPGVQLVGPEDLGLEDDPVGWAETGGRYCRRCGWAVPLMCAMTDGRCHCGGQLL